MKKHILVLLMVTGMTLTAQSDESGSSALSAGAVFWMPETIDFCGDTVPLDRGDVRERLETQLRLYGRNLAQLELWVKRMHRYFPHIETELKKKNLPDDLKYITVIESALQTRIISSANALGPWQFIESTAQRYNLRINECVDERLDIRKSTRAALQFLTELHSKFPRWATAVAAYNIGEGRILNECYEQGTDDYYDMILPVETDRYVMKIITAKLILENPARYGLDFDQLGRFADPETESVSLELEHGIPVRILAYAAGMSNREFILANPWIVNPFMKKGTYNVEIRNDCKDRFSPTINSYSRLVRDTVGFAKAKVYKIGPKEASIRLGPDTSFPVFRMSAPADRLPFKGHTSFKDRGYHWYLFEVDRNKNGWIWGGELDLTD